MENLILQLLQAIQGNQPTQQQSLLQQIATPTPQTMAPGQNQTALIKPNHGFKFPAVADMSPGAVDDYLKREEKNYQPPASAPAASAPAAQVDTGPGEPTGQWAKRIGEGANSPWLSNASIGPGPGHRWFGTGNPYSDANVLGKPSLDQG